MQVARDAHDLRPVGSGPGWPGARRVSRRWLPVVAGSVLAAVVLSGCTDGEGSDQDAPPQPPVAEEGEANGSLGAEVAVILPPRGQLDGAVWDQLAASLQPLAEEPPEGISQLRLHTPGSRVFARDLAGLFGERGLDLVCAVGADALSVTQEASTTYRGTRYCAAPADRDDPPVTELQTEEVEAGEVVRLEVRSEELGHVAGVAARRRAGDGSVGLLIGDGPGGVRFAAGLEAGLEGAEVVLPEQLDGELGTEADLAERAAVLVEHDVEVVVLDGSAGSLAALEVLDGSSALVGPAGLLGGAVADEVVLAWSTRWQRVLDPLLTGLAGEDPGRRSFGFEQEVFDLASGPASNVAVGAAVADAVAAISEGTRDPLEPAPQAGRPPVAPPATEDDEDDTGDDADAGDAGDDADEGDAGDDADGDDDVDDGEGDGS